MEIFSLVIVSFVASIVGTLTSFGTSTFMVPVLGFFYPLPLVLLFSGIIHWFGNLWKMFFFRSGAHFRLILLFGIPGIIASYFGARLVPDVPEEMLSRLLGIFFILYVLFLFKEKDWEMPKSSTGALVGGILSGFFSGIFGVGGAIRAAFLTSYNLKKAAFIFTAGAIGIFIDSGRIIQYAIGGTTLDGNILIALLVSIPASFLGGYVGRQISNIIPEKKFRMVICIALLVMAVVYLIWP